MWKTLTPSPSIRNMTAAEAAYIGAMLDAEGNTPTRENGWGSIVIDISEPEVISALLRASGVGNVYGYWPTNGNKLMMKWQVARQADLQIILEQIAPYSVKAQHLLVHTRPLIDQWRDKDREKHTCVKCGKNISGQRTRCGSCAQTERQARERTTDST